jgi:hypothetical protein
MGCLYSPATIENIVQNMIVYWWLAVFFIAEKEGLPSGEENSWPRGRKSASSLK